MRLFFRLSLSFVFSFVDNLSLPHRLLFTPLTNPPHPLGLPLPLPHPYRGQSVRTPVSQVTTGKPRPQRTPVPCISSTLSRGHEKRTRPAPARRPPCWHLPPSVGPFSDDTTGMPNRRAALRTRSFEHSPAVLPSTDITSYPRRPVRDAGPPDHRAS
ncbi:hypothetical protein B0H13DRAFT_223521 [Mycena leptocephala]|nr:hypothetical protein B0H13DRAFT_223521 [Mycena leptocephala]